MSENSEKLFNQLRGSRQLYEDDQVKLIQFYDAKDFKDYIKSSASSLWRLHWSGPEFQIGACLLVAKADIDSKFFMHSILGQEVYCDYSMRWIKISTLALKYKKAIEFYQELLKSS